MFLDFRTFPCGSSFTELLFVQTQWVPAPRTQTSAAACRLNVYCCCQLSWGIAAIQSLERSALKEIICLSCCGQKKTIIQTFSGCSLSMTHAKNQNFFCKLKITGKVDVQGVFIRARSVLACSPLSSGNTWMPDPAEQVGMH